MTAELRAEIRAYSDAYVVSLADSVLPESWREELPEAPLAARARVFLLMFAAGSGRAWELTRQDKAV